VRTALKLLELKKEQGVRVTLAFEWQQLIERRLPGCPMEVRARAAAHGSNSRGLG
jgi:hypothetical protein